jgi:protein phosphatase
MRGNHEAPTEFPFLSHDLPEKLSREFGKNLALSIYHNKILHLFQLLSLFVFLPEHVIMVHGGLPTELELLRSLNAKSIQDKSITNAVMEELLWNDPIEHINYGLDWEYSRRGYGKHFGIEITRKWLKASAAKLVIRGHEPCQGFKINHEGKILTLFSCREAYPNFGAAYLRISGDELLDLAQGKDLVQHIRKLAI